MKLPFQDRLHTAVTLGRLGLRHPVRPDRAALAGLALLRFGPTPAGAVVGNAARWPSDPGVIDDEGELTWGELHLQTNAIANALSDRGVNEGDAVAILARNHRWFVEATVACSKLGAHVLLLNTEFSAPQARDVLGREKPAAILYDAEFAAIVVEATRGRRITRIVALREGLEPRLEKERERMEEDENLKPKERREAEALFEEAQKIAEKDPGLEDILEEGDDSDVVPPDEQAKQIILTSGTTGTPKGASRGAPDALDPVAALLERVPLRTRERAFVAAPLFHAWGLANFQSTLALSSTLILQRKFDPERTLQGIEEHRPTVLAAVPVMLKRMLDLDPEVRDGYDTSSLRVVFVSGSALSPDLAERWMNAYGDNLYNLYGSTEIAWAAIATPRDLREAPGTVGRPPRGTRLEILSDDDKPVEHGETGRIFVGHEYLFEGYTSGESEEMVDGMMSAGDVGHLDDDGRLHVDGRADDMIVSGGENVYPEEVEDLIAGLSGVDDAAVVGVDDEEFGQRLKAYVVKGSGGSVSEKDIKEHVRKNAARYKVPREVEFLDELPRNAAGKVAKKELEQDDSDDGDDG